MLPTTNGVATVSNGASSGLGVSGYTPERMVPITEAIDRGMRRARSASRRMASTCAASSGSGEMGPEPIIAGSSVGTSERRMGSTSAGCSACASRPAPQRVKRLRTALVFSIGRPAPSSRA